MSSEHAGTTLVAHPQNSPTLNDFFVREQSRQLHAGLDKFVRSGCVPGVTAIVCVNGYHISASSGFADYKLRIPFSGESRFEISCLMKCFVSLLALALSAERKLDLSAPIGYYLDDLKSAAPEKAEHIRVQHLLSHSSGYRGADISQLAVKAGYDWDKFVDFMKNTSQLFIPGTVFNYEHTEHVVLGEIIRRVANRPVNALLADRLFDPVGVTPQLAISARKGSLARVQQYIKNSQGCFVEISPSSPGKFWRTSLSSSTLSFDEVASIFEMILSGLVLSEIPDLLDLLQKPYIRTPRTIKTSDCELMPEAFGLGCALYQHDVIGHNFSTMGQTCALRIVPSERAVILVGMNAWVPHDRDRIVQWILSSFVEHSSAGTNPSDISTAELFGGFTMQSLQGTYWGSYQSEISVAIDDGRLLLSTPGRSGSMRLCEIELEEGGGVRIWNSKPIPIVFFADPHDGVPCLTLGLTTYKRVNQGRN